MSIWSKLSDNKAVTGVVAALGLGGLVYWYAVPQVGPIRIIVTNRASQKRPLLPNPPKSPTSRLPPLRLKSTNSKEKSTSQILLWKILKKS